MMIFRPKMAPEYFGEQDYAVLCDDGVIFAPSLAPYEIVFDKYGNTVGQPDRFAFSHQAFVLGFLRLVIYPMPKIFRKLHGNLWMLREEFYYPTRLHLLARR